MEDQLIAFETAKLAKEKGFDIKTYYSYKQPIVTKRGTNIKEYREFRIKKSEYEYTSIVEISYSDEEYLAPTQSLLQKWLREEHNFFIYVTPTSLGDNAVFIKDCWDKTLLENKNVYNNAVSCRYTYEEALEIGLQEALKLIK